MSVRGRFQGVGQIKFKWRVAALVMAEVPAIAPAIGEKVGRADGQNHPFAVPGFAVGNLNHAPVPAHFVTRSGAMIAAVTSRGLGKTRVA